jgi:putative ABC transport system permease protein
MNPTPRPLASDVSPRTAPRWPWLEQAGQDVRYGCRQLVKSPGFAATVIVTLALGIGACTVVFTAVNSTLLHPMAGDATTGRDVIIHETNLPRVPQMQLSPPMFLDVERQATSFEVIAGWASQGVNLDTDTEPLQLRAAAITPKVLDIWGTRAELGRSFTAQEFTNRERVAMLSYGLWQRAFGGSPAVLNRAVNIDGAPCTIVGIISPRFARYGSDIDLWVPLTFTDQQRTEQRGAHFLQTTGRLKPGVSLAQAQAELDVIAANIARQYPDTNKGGGLLVREFGSYINRSLAPMLYVLLGAVGCVLLIACANVANLLLARASVRQREISIRAALGAGRGRLVRQLLAESMVLAVLGGGLGVMLAQWGLRFIRIYGPAAGTDLARLAYIELDPSVLAFTLGFSLLTGVVFGLAPAWLSAGVDVNEVLKQGGRGNSAGGLRGRLRQTLVIVEVGLALVLLAGAGLLLRSFARLAEVDPGFVAEHVASLQVGLNGRKYGTNAQRIQFADALLERIRGLPGVDAAALSNLTPFNGVGLLAFNIEGRAPSATQPAGVPYLVTADYFRAMRLRLLRGRFLDARDGVTGPPAFAINETLARQYFPNEDPLGRSLTINFGKSPGLSGEIVGVVGDVMQGNPGEPSPPQFYLPWPALSTNGFQVLVRTTGEPSAALSLLKAQVYAVDRNQPILAARTLGSFMDDKLARSHLMLMLLGIYGLIALVIAAVGIYGVMAYSVSQRTMEFGIRMALGASRGNVLRQVLRQGMLLVGIGVTIGIAAALALGRVVESMLYHLSPRDPVTLAAIVLLLLVVSLVACLVPARRATKVDPMVALRNE